MASYGITPLYADALLAPLTGASTRVPMVCAQLHDGPPGADGTSAAVEDRQQMTFGAPDSGAIALTGGQPSWEIDASILVTGVSLWSGFEDDTTAYALYTIKANPPVQLEVGDVAILGTCGLEWLPASQGLWHPVGTVEPPTALASARMLVPSVSGSAFIFAPLALATAAALAPAVLFPVPIAHATATALVPTVSGSANVVAPLATATAHALVPTVVQSVHIAAPLATATAHALVPTIKIKSWLATGAGAKGTSSPVALTDTVPVGTGITLIWVGFTDNTVAAPTIGLTLGGAAATLVLDDTWGAATPFIFLACYAVVAPPSGSQVIDFTCATVSTCVLDTVHYQGVTTVGAPISLAGQAAAAAAISVPSSDPNTIYAQAFFYRAVATADTFSSYNQNQRELVAGTLAMNQPLLLGDAPGNGGTLVFSANRTTTTYPWGAMVVPLT